MRLSRMLLALGLLSGLAGVAYVRQANEPAGSKMANAAERLLASLSAEQRAKATFAFDDKERFNWDFVPLQDRDKKPTRKGLPLENMTGEQKDAARALLAAGTSPDGYAKATTIMSLESILNELEKGGSLVRNPEWYFFTLFGTPSKTGRWGWRVEGHHLSLNFAVDGGKIIAATPAFFGANPATVMQGPRKGTKTLMDADELARELFGSLDDSQKKVAYQEKDFPEIKSHTTLDPEVGQPKGLAASKMTAKQRGLVLKLLQAYSSRMPPDVAEAEMSAVHKAGLDQIHFAYSGGVESGKKHTYRVEGPSFIIEFLNVQADSAKNPANHIHSVWRNTKGDFGITK
jgi:Protein of unknown function (DUF3500)